MKIAVTSQGESPESPIDQRFGRAKFFMLYDIESGLRKRVTAHETVNAVPSDRMDIACRTGWKTGEKRIKQ